MNFIDDKNEGEALKLPTAYDTKEKIAHSLFGSIPDSETLEDTREERLSKICFQEGHERTIRKQKKNLYRDRP